MKNNICKQYTKEFLINKNNIKKISINKNLPVFQIEKLNRDYTLSEISQGEYIK
jgi:hypothetical protein